MTIARIPPLRGLFLIAAMALCAVPARADSTSTAASDSSRRSITLPPVDVGGFFQLDFRQVFNGYVRHEFGIRRARVSLTGKAVPRVGYQLTIKGDRWADQPVGVLDASASVEVCRAIQVQVGQFKYDFDIEGHEADELLPVVDRSWAAITVAGALDPRNFGSYITVEPQHPFRDRGATVRGETRWRGWNWGTSAGVFQGSGARGYDDNEVSWVLQARVGRENISASYGWMNSPYASASGDAFNTAWTAGIDATWEWGRVRAEAYAGQNGVSVFRAEDQGGYVLAVFRVHRAIHLSARWQTIRLKNEVESTSGSGTANGFDIAPRLHFMRAGQRTETWFGLDYMVRKGEPFVAYDMAAFNDGSIVGGPMSSDTWRSLVVARLQIAF